MIINTITVREYRLEVTSESYVQVYKNGELIDWPGPWASVDGAISWANQIADYLKENDL